MNKYKKSNKSASVKRLSRFSFWMRRTTLMTFTAMVIVASLAVGDYVYSSRGRLSAYLFSPSSLAHVNYDKNTALEKAVLVDPIGFTPEYVTARLSDKKKDPLFRAASLSLFAQNSAEQKNAGSAALVEVDGALKIVSVGHVIDELKNDPHANRYVHIPGVGFLSINDGQVTYATRFDPNNGYDGDPILLIPLTDAQQTLLRHKINDGVIAPLQIDEEMPVFRQEFGVANPKTGKYIPLTYVNTRLGRLKTTSEEDKFHQFIVSYFEDPSYFVDQELTLHEILDMNEKLADDPTLNTDELICQGASGSPIVRKDNPKLVIAFVSGGTNFIQNEYQGLCNAAPIARPLGRP